LESLTTQPAGELVTALCEREIAHHISNWQIDEAQLAHDFVEFFKPYVIPLFHNLTDLCGRLSIEVFVKELPFGHSGLNCCYGERRAIVVSEAELPALSREHTLLHELREILEYKFRELGHAIAEDEDDLEVRAECFAASVRMDATSGMWLELFESASNLNATWKRYGAYALVGFGVVVQFISILGPWVDYLQSNPSRSRLQPDKSGFLR
jgi:hypothetical protein